MGFPRQEHRVRWDLLARIGLGLTAAAVVANGVANTRRLAVTRERLPIPDLPAPFDGFRLLHLADLHLRRGSAMPGRLLALAEELAPDLVCLTGDYVQHAAALPELRAFLRALAARWAVVGVFGNADYRPGISGEERARWAACLPFLENSALRLERQGAALWIAGVDDPHLGRDSLPTALAMVPAEAPVVLLAHSPEVILRSLDPRVRAIFSGHTHGGQICLPGGLSLYHNTALPRRYATGRHVVDGATLYVSRGIGSTRLPLRYGCLPEVTLFTLALAARGSRIAE